MYPIKLNLLSPEKRRYLNRMLYFQFIKNALISTVFVFCVSGIALLGGQWILQEYANDVSTSFTLTVGLHESKNEQIRQINELIKNIDALQATHQLWSPLIVNFANAIPDNVVISSMFFDKEKILISGMALTRADLLSLQTNLNALEFVEKTDIPLSQLTERENINFSITSRLKP